MNNSTSFNRKTAGKTVAPGNSFHGAEIEESQQDFKKLPPDWIYNFEDSKLNVKTLILDINRNKKDPHVATNSRLYPVPSFPKEVQQTPHDSKIGKGTESFKDTYSNYVNEGHRLNLHAANLNKKNIHSKRSKRNMFRNTASIEYRFINNVN